MYAVAGYILKGVLRGGPRCGKDICANYGVGRKRVVGDSRGSGITPEKWGDLYYLS
jgi:hypothetical protein